MKNIIKGIVIIALLFSIPSCYSEHLITSANNNNLGNNTSGNNNLKDVYNGDIVFVETKDGHIYVNENKVKIFNSEKGVYVVDSTGTKLFNYNELQSVKVKQLNTWHSVLMFSGIGIGVYLILLATAFANLKVS
ncbi:MAG: hypothetical protein ACM3MI_15695 [Clostridiales bacterium]